MIHLTTDERVDRALLGQMQRLLQRITTTAPAGVAVFLVATWRSLDHRWLVAYGAFALGMCAVTFFQLAYEHRARCAGRVRRHTLPLLAANMTVSSFGWGTVTWMTGGAPQWVQALAVVYVVGYIAANMAFNAPTRVLYHVFQTPLVVSSIFGLVVFGDGLANVFAVVIAVFAANAAVLHGELHAVFRGAVAREVGNADLVAQLQEQQHEMEVMNARLAHDATHDALTGLANRILFGEHLDRALARARRRGGEVAVLYLDLDRFKVINDSLGHGAGDQLLAQFAARIGPALRTADVFARLGGDEFTVLLTDGEEAADPLVVARRIQKLCTEPFRVHDRHVVTSVSIGVARFHDRSDSADDLLRRADVALYRAKERGRNRVELFDESLRAILDRRLDDELAVRAALAAGEMTAWFQPVIELASGRIVAAEALVRWNHPTDGIRMPGAFLPVIEECGLLRPLLHVMIAEAAGAVAALRDAGCLADEFRVWVNVDPEETGDGRSTDRLVRYLNEVGVSATHLGAEVTERAVMRDLQGARRHLENLKALGIAVALDDFGTGHSSLALLQTLPVDTVKIDRSFVRDMHDDERDRALVMAIIRLTRDLGLHVVAEGIENTAQQDLLASGGCRVGQGFLYSPAVPVETLVGWLRDGAPWQTGRWDPDAGAVDAPGDDQASRRRSSQPPSASSAAAQSQP